MTHDQAKPLIIHDAALLFPEMSAEEFSEFKADIQRHGLREPILKDTDGCIVDGRHRLRACQELGIEPQFDVVKISDVEIPDWVVSRNLHRRHLTTSQRAMVAAELVNLTQGGKQPANSPLAVSQSGAAKKLGVSERSARTAVQVKKRTPQLVKAVKEQVLSLNAAAEIAALPDHQRDEVVQQVTNGDITGALEKVKRSKKAKQISTAALPAEYATLFQELDDLPRLLTAVPLAATLLAELADTLAKACSTVNDQLPAAQRVSHATNEAE